MRLVRSGEAWLASPIAGADQINCRLKIFAGGHPLLSLTRGTAPSAPRNDVDIGKTAGARDRSPPMRVGRLVKNEPRFEWMPGRQPCGSHRLIGARNREIIGISRRDIESREPGCGQKDDSVIVGSQ